MATTKYKLNSRGYYEAKIWDGTYTKSGAKHRKSITSKKSSADLEKKGPPRNSTPKKCMQRA